MIETKDRVYPGSHNQHVLGVTNPRVKFSHLLKLQECFQENATSDPYYIFAEGLDFGVERGCDYVVRTAGYIAYEFSLPANVIKVFTTNCCVYNDHFECLPFGVHLDYQLKYHILLDYFQIRPEPKANVVYVNFGCGSHPVRHQIMHTLKSSIKDHHVVWKPYPSIINVDAQYHYYRDMSASTYTACPFGNGWDSYRVWEAVLLDSIPIVQNNAWAKHFEEYGFVLTDNWVVNENWFDEYEHRLEKMRPLKEKLKQSYWKDLLESL